MRPISRAMRGLLPCIQYKDDTARRWIHHIAIIVRLSSSGGHAITQKRSAPIGIEPPIGMSLVVYLLDSFTEIHYRETLRPLLNDIIVEW